MNEQPEKRDPFFEQLDQLIGSPAREVAEQHYIDLPYHNFEHALNVIRKSLDLVETCNNHNIEVNEIVVVLSALFHDAGYHENLKDVGFDSKEEYSAYLAEQELEKLGFDDKIIEQIKACIISTHQNSPFTKNEQKVIRAADLAGLADDYEIFEKNNNLLREEYNLLNDTKVSDEDWKLKTKEIVDFYLAQDIKLTPEHDDASGVSVFHKKARENLEKYLKS